MTSEPEEANLAIASSSSLTQAKLPLQSHNSQSKFAQLEVELGGSVTLQCPQGRKRHQLRKFKLKVNFLKS